MPIDLSQTLRDVLPPITLATENAIWFGEASEPPSLGFTRDEIGLWNLWRRGEKSSEYRWDGALRGAENVEKLLVLDKSTPLRHLLRPQGRPLVPFYLADQRYLKPVADGGPQVGEFHESSTIYGDHGPVLAAYRDQQLFAVGGCALPSTLRIAHVPIEQLYEELASPEGGECFRPISQQTRR